MLKLISKLGCSRCEAIKNYLTERNILFNLEMAEEEGYNYWRDLITEKTGKLGFPILIKDDTYYLNGSSEEILEGINNWNQQKVGVNYTWGE